MTRKDFTDEDLTAYLDGEADAQLAESISAAAEHDVALQARIEALDMPLEAMTKSFDSLLEVAPAMNPMLFRSASGVSSAKLMTAMAASLVVGALISFLAFSGEKLSDWRDYAAAYHVLYVNGTLAGVENSAIETTEMLSHLGNVLGHDVSQAPRDTVLDFKRGQVLGFEGQPMLQLAYLSPLGDPVALCLIRTDGGDADIEMRSMEGLAAAQWQSDGIAYLLIGGTDSGLIKDAAVRFSDAL